MSSTYHRGGETELLNLWGHHFPGLRGIRFASLRLPALASKESITLNSWTSICRVFTDWSLRLWGGYHAIFL